MAPTLSANLRSIRLGPGNPLDLAERYLGTFAVLRDAFSGWNGEAGGWRPVRSTLTAEVALRSLRSIGPPLGTYFIARDGTTTVLALDFDSDDGLGQALRLAQAAWQMSLAAYVEPSRRGAHVWIVLDGSVPAQTARQALLVLVERCGLAGNPKVEIRPAHDRLARPDALGFALRLPVMAHPLTGVRKWPCDPRNGRQIGESLAELLDGLQRTGTDAVLDLARQYRPPQRARRAPGVGTFDSNRTASVTGALATYMGVENATPGTTVRCPAHEDAHASLSIFPDDRRAYCHAPGCLLGGDGHGVTAAEIVRLARGPYR